VPGLRVGHAADPIGLTGVTVVLCDRPATGGVALRGGANDVVGLDYLHPRHLVTTVNGAVLGGGSRFGEEAIYGVMRWLEERGVGFTAGPAIVPHVPGAFLFDLGVGDRRARPTREMGYEAAARAVAGAVAEGSFAAPEHTTIGVVATNARLDRADAATLASLGMLGFARALSPPHTAFDGDTLFALSLGDLRADLTRLGLAAADAVAHAICRGARA